MRITFKENYLDIRNSKLIDNVNELREYRIKIKVVDPLAEESEMQRERGIKLSKIEEVTDMDSVILLLPRNI